MWEDFLEELFRLLPQLGVTFLGVFLAFSLDRAIDWYKRREDRKHLLRDLRNELMEIKGKLTGEGNLHFPDIWDSAVSSGQIRLLRSDQVMKLSSNYRDVKGIEYEAKRLRDLAEEYRLAQAKGQIPQDVGYLWGRYSTVQKSREAELLRRIEELLKEKWWGRLNDERAK